MTKSGNTTSEEFNGQTRTYCYDKCGSGYLTNQLNSASGDSVLDPSGMSIGYMSLVYDQNGNVSQDGVAANASDESDLSYSFLYNPRHHLREIDQVTSNSSNGSLQSIPYQQDYYDGADRVEEVVCPNQQGVIAAFGFCGQGLPGRDSIM